jgi:DNA (cytosine-5)-methyltransferase 1
MNEDQPTLTFGSLFSGIGGLDLGLERAGMRCEWQVENNDFCQKVLAKHWPDVARHGDVRGVGKHNLSRPDCIAGGFPCQDISDAGKKAGIDGERSGLWGEFSRIIREIRPRYIIVENVAALTHRGMGRVLGDLAKSRYDAEWQVLPAAAFGAPHLRERVFIVAYRQGMRLEKPVLDSLQRRSPFQSRGISTNSPSRNHWQTDQPSLVGVVYGVSEWVHRSKGLGNAVVPQVAEYVGRCIMAAEMAESECVA